MQATCVGLIAAMTLREAVRQRLFAGLAVVAAMFVLGVQGLRDFNFGTAEAKFVVDFGLGVLGLFGSVLTITVTTLLFFNEIEQRTVLTVLARPVQRGTFVVGKWLGLVALVGLFCVTTTGLLAGVLGMREDAAVRFGDVLLAGGLQWLKFALLAALTLLLAGLCRTSLLTGLLAFLVLAICQLHPLLAEVAQRDAGMAFRAFARLGMVLLPNSHAFDLSASVGAGEPVALPRVGAVALYGICYVTVTLGLAAYAFRRREI